MGKSYKSHREDRFGAATSWVALEDIHISDLEVAKLLARDFHQINEMRQRIERGEELMPVSLHERASGGYSIGDGRHRVVAARLAGSCSVAAEVV